MQRQRIFPEILFTDPNTSSVQTLPTQPNLDKSVPKGPEVAADKAIPMSKPIIVFIVLQSLLLLVLTIIVILLYSNVHALGSKLQGSASSLNDIQNVLKGISEQLGQFQSNSSGNAGFVTEASLNNSTAAILSAISNRTSMGGVTEQSLNNATSVLLYSIANHSLQLNSSINAVGALTELGQINATGVILGVLTTGNSSSSGGSGGLTQADLTNSTDAILNAIVKQTVDLNGSITANADATNNISNSVLGWVQPLTQAANKTLKLTWVCNRWGAYNMVKVCIDASIVS